MSQKYLNELHKKHSEGCQKAIERSRQELLSSGQDWTEEMDRNHEIAMQKMKESAEAKS